LIATPEKEDRHGRRSTPGLVNAAVSIAIVVLVASLALTAAQSPPPAIAELSPSAVQQIKDAPSEQTSAAGEGDGGGDGGFGATTTTTLTATTLAPGVTPPTAPPPIERARVRRCVGNPPRQTEDPQSPPCVPYFEGDNGGATYRGVTKDTITMTIPNANMRVVEDLMAYFNKRYEFYGRKLKLVVGGGGEDCQQRKAAAVAADTEQHAFAGLDANNGNAGPCFQAEMARRGLLSSAYGIQFDEDDMAALAPHLWQYTMGFDKILAGVGAMYCARLHGSNATRAPDPLLARSPRKLGVIIQNVLRDTTLSTDLLDRELAKCGAKVDMYQRLSTNDDTSIASPDKAALAMAQFKQANVTTILNLGIAFASQNISGAADAQQYYPEWLFTAYGGFDSNLVIHAFWPAASQRQSIMGITPSAPSRPYEKEPAFLAAKEVDPSVDPVNDLSMLQDFTQQYRALLVLASGIQMAGPILTPQTFGAAMKKIKFPYPADDPLRSGDVGFADDHSMTDDFVEFWWSEAAAGPNGYASDGSTGALCFNDNFARHRTTAWPKGPGSFFQGLCNAGV
jgi:hypothetical protein